MTERHGDQAGMPEPGDGSPGIAPERLTELLAGASVVQERALARLDFPALILDIPCGRIRAANQGAAELFDVPLSNLIGQVNTDAAAFDNPGAVKAALATLGMHGMDGYRARRTVTTVTGQHREVSVWCRAIDLEGVRRAVYIMTPTTERSGRPGWAQLAVLPLEPLVVGTWDGAGHIERVSSEVSQLLGWSAAEASRRRLLDDVHPADADRLNALRTAARGKDMVTCHFRLRHRNGSWVDVRCLLLPLDGDDDPRFAFAALPEPLTTPLAEATDAVADLEGRIRRLAAELRAARIVDEADRLPSVSDHPQLAELSSRQWEILSRLLRGDRVPTIAAELFLSPSTVRNHLTIIFEKFGVHSQAALLMRLRSRPPR